MAISISLRLRRRWPTFISMATPPLRRSPIRIPTRRRNRRLPRSGTGFEDNEITPLSPVLRGEGSGVRGLEHFQCHHPTPSPGVPGGEEENADAETPAYPPQDQRSDWP